MSFMWILRWKADYHYQVKGQEQDYRRIINRAITYFLPDQKRAFSSFFVYKKAEAICLRLNKATERSFSGELMSLSWNTCKCLNHHKRQYREWHCCYSGPKSYFVPDHYSCTYSESNKYEKQYRSRFLEFITKSKK